MAPFFTGVARGFFKTSGGGPLSATGGTQYIPGNGYIYHTFTTSGTFTVSSGSKPAEILVVAGGGGGIDGYGGGGGGGGVVYDTSFPLVPGPYSVTVGPGGTGNAFASATNGGDSSFGPLLVAKGGGKGGLYPTTPGATGGSGGGGAEPTSTGGPGNQPAQPKPATATNYGFAGGNGSPNVGAYQSGGGGGAGGAGTPGPSNTTTSGGIGGPGQPFPGFEYPIVGLSPIGPEAASPTNNHYGGGGYGWGYIPTTRVAGGGGGGYPNIPQKGTDGLGGGGGANFYSSSTPPPGGTSKNGGSGVVIVRYLA